MQKWEYARITVSATSCEVFTQGNRDKYKYPFGGIPEITVVEVLNQMGQAGWAVCGQSRPLGEFITLKRPIEESAK